jgi:hypothetical protein
MSNEIAEKIADASGRIDNEVVSTIMDKLEQYAVGIGTTGEYLWGVMVKQAHVTALANLVGLVIGIVLLCTGIAIALNSNKLEKIYGEGGMIFACIISVMLFVGSLIGIAASECIPVTITCLINPEYWAFQKVMSIVK